MRIFANNKIWKKIVIIIGILLSFSIVVPEPVEADLGGKLMQPIMSLFIGIGDGINTVIQKMFLNREPAVLIISSGFNWWKVALGVAIGIGLIAVGIVTGGVGTIIIGSALTIAVVATAATGGNSSSENIAFQVVTSFTASMLSDKNELALPMMSLTPYEIFANKQNLFSVNFFKNLSDDEKYINGSDDEENKEGKEEKNKEGKEEKNEEGKKEKSKTLMYSLQDVIASWYKTFRLIAIVGMLPVLVYIGIRILVSAPSDKAKYKENLMDWGVAFLLIFAMHYIMSFSNLLIDQVTDMIDSVKISTKMGGEKEVEFKNQSVEGFLIGVDDEGKIDDDTTELIKTAYDKMISGDSATETTEKYKWCFWKDMKGTQAESADEAKILFWPCDNFVAQSRMYAQRAKGDFAYIGYGLIYVILTIYTCMFIFVYLRRFMYMAFLTLIAPLVALTYPIDKIRDGKAQAFEFWFKEYFYNLLLQPLHLLLYLILVGSALSFAAKNPIYVCVILGFMTPFEKLLKQMFGFRGETPGSLPGMAAGALMMGASQRIFGRHPKGLGGENGSNNSRNNGENDDGKPIKMKDVDTSGGNLIGSGSGAPNPGSGRGAPNPGGGRGAPNPGGGRGTPNPGGGRGAPNPGGRRNGVLSANSKRRLRKISAPLRYTGRAFGKYFKNNGKKLAKSAGKSAIRFAGGAASAAVGATGGMIAGVVSGDPSKAASYIAAGGVAAYSLGSRAAENIPNIVSSQANAIKDEYYLDNPDKYEEIQKNKQRKEWYAKNINTLKLNGINYKDLNKNGDLDDYIDHGFNAKQIVAAQQMRNEGFDHKQVMTIAAMADKYYEGATGVDSGKYKTKMKENLKSSTEGANLSDQQLNDAVDRSIGYMKNYHKHLDKVKTL